MGIVWIMFCPKASINQHKRPPWDGRPTHTGLDPTWSTTQCPIMHQLDNFILIIYWLLKILLKST